MAAGFLARYILCIFLSLRNIQGCLNLVDDCGASQNGQDDTMAFYKCQRLLPNGGCVLVPDGTYEIANATLSTSNIMWTFTSRAVIKPYHGMTRSLSVFQLGSGYTIVNNVTLHGQYPGSFTIDTSDRLFVPWNVRGIEVYGGIADFTLANIHFKMAFTNGTDQKSAIGFGNAMSGNTPLNPNGGRIINVTSVGSIWGYGLVQLQSGENLHFENLDGTGGVALRLETGYGAPGAYVGNITARNITCRDGHAAFMSEPHTQVNGAFAVQDLWSYGCFMTAETNGGYTQDGKPPGYFAASTIHGATAYYGTSAQKFKDETGPACASCMNENSKLNYNVTVTGLVSVGFPAPSNRSTCVYTTRFPLPVHCPYDGS